MILVSGTSGALGGLIHDRLAAIEGVNVVAGSRTGGRTGARLIDFDEPDTLSEGFDGVDVLVFVSAGFAEDDVVIARHGNVVDAAAKAGVRHVIYTSLAGSGDRLTISVAHRWTEARLAAAPFDVTILRNGLYGEIPAGMALSAVESGVFAAPWGDGRMPVVARADLADVAARVAVESSPHVGRTYELEGVEAVGGQDVADVLTEALGRPVRYEATSLGGTRKALEGFLEPYAIGHTISTSSNIGAGLLEPRDGDLTALLTAPPRSVRGLIARAVTA
jgi:NAD(P)H dehydrogenase (quinone)